MITLLLRSSLSLLFPPPWSPSRLRCAATSLVVTRCDWQAFSGDVEGGITMPVVVLFFVSALLALLFWCMRLTLKVVARLFKVSGQALQDSVAMIPVQSAIAFGGMVLQAAMIMLTLASVGWGRLLPAWPLDADGNPDKDQSPTCQWSFASNTTCKCLLHLSCLSVHAPVLLSLLRLY